MNNKLIKLSIFKTDINKKNIPFELNYNKGNYPLNEYILQCFHEKKRTSVILFRNEPLDDKVMYEDLKCDKLDSFQLYIFPEALYKQAFLNMIQKGKDFDIYYYALIKAGGDEAKAFDITQPTKTGYRFDLNSYIEKAEDYEEIYCAYSQYGSSDNNPPLSPWQYLKSCGLREDLYQDKKVKKFLDVYDTEFKYKTKIYEYYKFRLTKKELEIVDGLLYEYFKITLDTNDGPEKDSENKIIKIKQLVLNTYMHLDKNYKMTKSVLDCIV